MTFPIIVIKDKDKAIYCFTKEQEWGVISKGGESFYNDMTIYDSGGVIYLLNEISQIKMNIGLSLRYLQPMYKLTLKVKMNEKTDLDKLKTIVIEHIKKNEKYWLSLDSLDSLIKTVNSKSTFKDLFLMFR